MEKNIEQIIKQAMESAVAISTNDSTDPSFEEILNKATEYIQHILSTQTEVNDIKELKKDLTRLTTPELCFHCQNPTQNTVEKIIKMRKSK